MFGGQNRGQGFMDDVYTIDLQSMVCESVNELLIAGIRYVVLHVCCRVCSHTSPLHAMKI